ncbi:hypothetical protein DF164_28195 [Burkholderia stagnalis]|nr:hypothetical protein DF164_28195 [Burkholderia stagnalis]RQY68752.1 hypothetical protein DF110_19670 [Burkholderia stagnalis]
MEARRVETRAARLDAQRDSPARSAAEGDAQSSEGEIDHHDKQQLQPDAMTGHVAITPHTGIGEPLQETMRCDTPRGKATATEMGYRHAQSPAPTNG